jgi:CubicO group peptidase (beta-lactamase class C family)
MGWTQTNLALDRFVRGQLRRTGTPGAAVGIQLRGRSYASGYGVTNVDHPLPVTKDTLFQIGSTSKTFTATAIMRLVDQGKVALDAPVRRYVPDFRLRSADAGRRATVRHLLTHTGGWLGDYFEDSGRGDDALARMMRSVAKLKQLTPLGEVWSYNNAAFYIAGRVIERVTGKPYETAMRELILDPLELRNSFFFPEEVITRRFVVGHMTHPKTGKSTVIRQWHLPRAAHAAGGIVSDVGDQLAWARFHMGDGRAPSGKRLLKASTLKQMQRKQAEAGALADAVGISWLLRYIDGTTLVSHGGTTAGQLSAFTMVPERDFAVTVLTNSTRGSELHRAVVDWALEHYIGVRRPELAHIPVDDLRAYTGKYRVESSGTEFDVVARNGGLTMKMPRPQATVDGRRPPKPPDMHMRFYAPDRVVGTNGVYAGTRSEFVRNASGRVAWFRFGGRIHRHLPPKAAARR